MSYRVMEENFWYDIVEKSTEFVVCRVEKRNRKSKDIARTVCRKLNLGSGFDGSTPEFFSVKNEKTGE
jgi:hypothetical protein